MFSGVRPIIRLALAADRDDALRVGVDRDDARLVEHDAAAAHVDQGVCGPQIHGHIAADQRQCTSHRSLPPGVEGRLNRAGEPDRCDAPEGYLGICCQS